MTRGRVGLLALLLGLLIGGRTVRDRSPAGTQDVALARRPEVGRFDRDLRTEIRAVERDGRARGGLLLAVTLAAALPLLALVLRPDVPMAIGAGLAGVYATAAVASLLVATRLRRR